MTRRTGPFPAVTTMLKQVIACGTEGVEAAVGAAVEVAVVPGFTKIRVRRVTDPDAPGNTRDLKATGVFGSFHIALSDTPLPENPKTLWPAALGVEPAVIGHFSHLEI